MSHRPGTRLHAQHLFRQPDERATFVLRLLGVLHQVSAPSGRHRLAQRQCIDHEDVQLGQLQVFRLQPLSYEDGNSRAAEEYRLIIIAQVDFYRRKTDERLSRRLVRGEATFEPSGDLSLSKLDALPEASEDLARHIVKTVVEYW